jgi:hypothetical protein
MKAVTGRRVRVEAQAENGHSGLSRLAIVFKEILKQIASDDAEKPFEACRNGKSFTLSVQENSRGEEYMCAHRCSIAERFPTNGIREIDYLDLDPDLDLDLDPTTKTLDPPQALP